ncbi:MAG: alanine/glycine:cation symporter family protein [Anaerovoracaceae bacterium]|jgi:AGCS family alanine or glycine:cation symporter
MDILKSIDDTVWGVPMIILIMGTGIFLTVRLGALQFRRLGKALYYMVHNEEGGTGEVSSFGALCTALAATIGTGNIVGVATAVMAGGPGALFWMVLAACFGMATKFSEGLLAVRFRDVSPDGHSLGGPFLYIEKGMGRRWKWLAKLFSVFGICAGLLGIGTITQVNGIAEAALTFFDPHKEHTFLLFGMDKMEYSYATLFTAIFVAALTALVVVGGIKRIASVTSIIVPFMAIVYVAVCVTILIYNAENIPGAIVTIVKSAFGLRAVGGGVLGAMMLAMQNGIARGIFSNEAGLGSAPIAAAAAQTHEPVRQGLVSMTGTFIDTIIICTMTGLTIVSTGAWQKNLEGVNVTIQAFRDGLPWSEHTATMVVMLCLMFFAFTTILGWDYYSERCLEYLIGGRRQGVLLTYRWIYVLAVLVGPFIGLEAVWTLADICNGLMAIPNLIGLLALNGVIVYESKSYFRRLSEGRLSDNH